MQEQFNWYLACYTYYVDGEPIGQGDVTFKITVDKFTARPLEDIRAALVAQIKENAPQDITVTVNFNSLTHMCCATEEEFYK